ncbi:hypothetical protein [Microbispora hainanensis]|uniref:MarR family transcriptional regulator n=1 Tax=Microbispora hainanensis TaxID=568844 RepID=A0ABZ1SRH5_9ACTN|nr:hypothetical protein [Microbispora hainanensis]
MPDKPLSFSATCALLILMAEDREMPNPELKEKYGVTITGKERTTLNEGGFVTSRKTGRSFSHVLTDKGWHHASELARDGISAPGTGFAAAAVKALVGNLQRHIVRSEHSLAEIYSRQEDLLTEVNEAPKAETTPEPIAQPPIAQPPIAQSPIPQPPVAQTPVAQTPAAQPSVAETPTTETSISGTPTAQPPVPQPPVAQPSVAETPTTETSISETPTAQPPIVETPPASVPALSSEDIETLIRKAYAQLADMPNTWVSLTQLRPLLGDAPRDKVDATLVEMTRRPDVRFVPWENQKTLTQADRDAAVVIGDQPKHRIWIGA